MNDLSDLHSQFVTARAPRVSVVLTVRDAVDDLADRIAELAVEAEFAHLNLCEMILVDDGSRDLTWAVLLSLVRHEPRLRPIRLRARFGAEAVRETGVLAATGDIVVTLEPETPVSELGQLAGLIEAEHDVVIAGDAAAYRREVLWALIEEGLALAAMPLAARRQGYRVGHLPGMPRRRSGLAEFAGALAPVFADERAAGYGMMAGTAAMLAGVPVMAISVAAGVGLALAGLQIAGVALLGSLLLARGNRRGRAQGRIAETLLGHGARD